MGSTQDVSKSDFSCVRDYLITSLLVDNASRSGAIASLTTDHVDAARKDGNGMLLTVYDHKTLTTCGPAILCVQLTLFNYLSIFITRIWANIMRITKSVSKNVFVSFTGFPLSSSAVSEQIASFWKSATGKHMNASLMRKSCVSIVHNKHPELKSDLAAHMNHALKTAENTYFVEDKLKKSARTAAC
eukprot:gene10073-18719_t